MNPDAHHIWQAPRWALAVLLAMLGMLGPFSIDTYIPAFSGIAASLNATPVQMQQTLSAYLFGFAFMSLFHGALSDSVGRRPVVLWGLAAFTLASMGCALSQSIGQLVFFRAVQGLTTGAGIVVSRAVVRDMFPPAQAQKVMSQITIYFGVAPAVAPMIGGVLFAHLGWHSVFWFLTGVGVFLWLANYRLLPETLHLSHRQPLKISNLMQGYWQLGRDPRFLLLALASGVPFNGMFLYVLSAPVFLGEHLALPPTQFFWFFVLTISGIMSGAWVSGRMAGRISPKRQIKYGFLIMLCMAIINLGANMLFTAQAVWAMFPISIFAFGWAMMVPVVTLLVLDLHPDRRGMASSLQAFVGSSANGLVAGVIAPLVMHSTVGLAATSLALLSIGLGAWVQLRRRWASIGA
ncbi:multidrug effflux MFS transporter [Rhodoferax fermentans]|uniref:Bcr/CflA family efflux transporter n=1 Tax=Rhodoferax fermentans TaxID=28066 RepID=A0A1T1AR52_RHOFE|nr:multidrug effflux MFS transporter [Rhodoferax fermentans]MBK1682852.1 Bcr/CflA family drug resistance efflux transporter [Rhodoferax fermentans]OOV06438.1 Bcr/CflA family drug resistance efflux transporter [Rhodoferax fermentans]